MLVARLQWTSATRTWQQIGEVVDAVGSNRKQLYNGQEYDYVFDVDIKEGAPPLKLPYNASQNPYDAASKFLIANDLPADYTDQVVQFIEKNTAGVTLGTAGNEYVDPYTGASRYTAGGAAPALGSGGFSGGDPYTGELSILTFQGDVKSNAVSFRWRTNYSHSLGPQAPTSRTSFILIIQGVLRN